MATLDKRNELLSSIQHMDDADLDKLYQLVAKDFPELVSPSSQTLEERPIGSMKGMLVYMADDFNEPLEDFADYMPEDKPTS